MLHRSAHCRNAFERDPIREARLLWFAKTPSTPGTPDADDEKKYSKKELRNMMMELVKEQTASIQKIFGDAKEDVKDDAAEEKDETVEGAKKGTREKTEAVLNGGGAEPEKAGPPRAETLRQRMDAVYHSMDEVTKLTRAPAIRSVMYGLPKEDQAIIWGMVETFDHKRESSAAWYEVSTQMAAWEAGEMEPDDFITFAWNQHRGDPRQAEYLAAMRKYKADHPELFRDKWKTMNAGSKIQAIKGLSEAGGMSDKARNIGGYLDEWEKELEKFKEALKKEAENAQSAAAQKKTDPMLGEIGERSPGFFGALGITFHSPLEIWEALKMVKDAYKDTFMEKVRQNATIIASGVSNALENVYAPYGKEVAAKMKQKANSEDNKKKNEFKEGIENNGFKDLFGSDGSGQTEGTLKDAISADDRPAAMAVLEVAAGHGWLYELGETSGTDWPITLFGRPLGAYLPKHWNEGDQRNYLTSLRGQNRKGVDEDRGKGKALVDQEPNGEKYIETLRDQLGKQNYWRAMGVAEGMMASGKVQNASSVIFVEFIRALREDPIARRYINKSVLNVVGSGISWGKANFTHNQLNMQRDNIDNLRWNPGDLNNAGDGVKTIAMIERKIIAADPSLGNRDKETVRKLDDLVAKVLSALTIDVNGTQISIYDSAFDGYRNETMKSIFYWYEDNVGKATPQDYLKQETEAVFADERLFVELFESGSTGDMDLRDKTQAFMGVLVTKVEELELKFGPDHPVTRKFRQETGRKLLVGIREGASEKSPLKWPDYNVRYMATGKKTEKDEKTPLLPTLIKKGFFTLDDILAIPIFGKSKEFKAIMQRQLGTQLPQGNTGSGAGAADPQLNMAP